MNRRRGAAAPIVMAVAAVCLLLSGCSSQPGASATPTPACSPVASTSGLDLNSPGTLTVGSDVSYPPQEYFDGSTPTGFDMDLGKALAAKLCLGFRAVNQGFDSIIPALNSGNYDVIISAMTITDERSKQVFFVPYFMAGEQLIVKQGSVHHPTKASDLCGLRVAVEKGTSESDELVQTVTPGCGSNPPTKLQFPTDPEALEALEQGGADVEFTDSPVAQYDVKGHPNLEVSSPVFETAPEGIAVRKSDASMQDAITRAYAALKADGTYDRLLAQWGLQASAMSSPTPGSASPSPS